MVPDASDSHPKGDRILTDFTSNSSDLGWHVVNDNVMGGRRVSNILFLR